jgi:hypothetical protein
MYDANQEKRAQEKYELHLKVGYKESDYKESNKEYDETRN